MIKWPLKFESILFANFKIHGLNKYSASFVSFKYSGSDRWGSCIYFQIFVKNVPLRKNSTMLNFINFGIISNLRRYWLAIFQVKTWSSIWPLFILCPIFWWQKISNKVTNLEIWRSNSILRTCRAMGFRYSWSQGHRILHVSQIQSHNFFGDISGRTIFVQHL